MLVWVGASRDGWNPNVTFCRFLGQLDDAIRLNFTFGRTEAAD